MPQIGLGVRLDFILYSINVFLFVIKRQDYVDYMIYYKQ